MLRRAAFVLSLLLAIARSGSALAATSVLSLGALRSSLVARLLSVRSRPDQG
jgi:hypothetical protein